MSSIPYLLIKQKCEQVFKGKYQIYDEDVIYDTMTSIICQYQKSADRIQNLEAWLVGAIHHHYCSYVAAKEKKKVFVYHDFLNDMNIGADAFHDNKLDVELIRKQISKLDTPYKEILQLRLFLDHSHKEIAEQLNITEVAVRKYYSRSVKKLAKMFETMSHFILISYFIY